MEPPADPRRSLEDLAEEYWEERMANEPLAATALGDRRFDGRLPDISPEGRGRISGQYAAVVRRCEEIPEAGLEAADRLRLGLRLQAGALQAGPRRRPSRVGHERGPFPVS